MNLLASLEKVIHEYGEDKTYWVAFSGGVDSHVLLSLCHSLTATLSFNLRAIHINHGLNNKAEQWALHCAKVCADYNISYVERALQIKPHKGESIEKLARQKRYAEFAECLSDNDILLTAHHQDDQAETLLLQLCRGAGPKGLAAMPREKKLARGFHVRPLLEFSREELEEYAKQNQLTWIDDDSNDNKQLTRNFLRNDILPLLKARWPTITRTISRTASHCADANNALETFACDLEIKTAGTTTNTLSVEKLLQLNDQQQKIVFRSWINRQGYPMPHSKKLTVLYREILTARPDSSPCVKCGNWEIRRYRDEIFIMPTLKAGHQQQTHVWNLKSPLVLPGIGTIYAEDGKDHAVLRLSAKIESVAVRFRRGGEIACVPKRGKHTLKNLFQEWGVPPWQRNRIPLIFVADKLISAVDYFIDEAYAANKTEPGKVIRWVEKGPLHKSS